MKICKELEQLFVRNWGCSNYLWEINNYLKSKHLQFIKRTNWILPHIVKETPIPEAPTIYPDASQLRMEGYKVRQNKQSQQSSVKKSELYAIIMVLLDFNESLNNYWLSRCRKSFVYRNYWICSRWFKINLICATATGNQK